MKIKHNLLGDMVIRINYEKLIDLAMHNIVREALKYMADSSSSSTQHYFYLSFVTHAPEVEIPDSLKTLYPKEMTIVLQHQFDNLEVRKNDFSVTLTFNGKPTNIIVPYKALTSFSDPSVNFSLKFKYFNKLYQSFSSNIVQSDLNSLNLNNDKSIRSEIKPAQAGEIHEITNIISFEQLRNKNKKK